MGVYFPNMKFPQNCGDCDLLYDCCACGVTHKRMDFETMDRERHPDCPAMAVPPHGRLIDADELTISTAVPLDGKPYQYVHIDNIKAAPTIIPAEEAEP